MRGRRRLSANQVNLPPRAQRAATHDAIREDEPEAAAALWRVKNDRVVPAGPRDVMALQRSLGNKGLRRTLDQYGRSVQRHSIPEGRQAVGDEDDEIPAQRFVQRQPAFGRPPSAARSRNLWGHARPAAIQRKGGGGAAGVKDPGSAGAKDAAKGGSPDAKAGDKEDEASKKAAEAEYKDFAAGGPYRINNYVPNTVADFGKFDAIYDPAARTLTADMRVKFTFPDSPLPEKADTLSEVVQKALIQATHTTYIANFLGQVQAGWSGKFSFRNVRTPQSIWGKLNPITVKVNVSAVDTGQHYTMKAWLKKSGRAFVQSSSSNKGNPEINLFKGDLDPSTQSFTGSAQTAPDEVARLTRNLPKIHFAPGSSTVEPKYIPDLRYVSDYLRRMNVPKFDISVIGMANKTGPEPANIKISQARADAVAAKLKEFGVTNHNVTAKGVGSTGATADGKFRKVDFVPSVVKGFKNIQDTTMHEFGHMLGLDDEYQYNATVKTTDAWRQKEIQKMLGDKAYGKGQEDKYADEVSQIKGQQSGSVMESGSEVRVYHYVTLWQALYDTAGKAAKQPAQPFTFADWKVNG